MPNLDLKTLTVLHEKRVEFVIPVPNRSGTLSYLATPDDLVMLLDDPIALYAKAHGVTKFEYRDWMEGLCIAYCSATTKAGSRCKNAVVGGYFLTAERWVELQGGYCEVHSGVRK